MSLKNDSRNNFRMDLHRFKKILVVPEVIEPGDYLHCDVFDSTGNKINDRLTQDERNHIEYQAKNHINGIAN